MDLPGSSPEGSGENIEWGSKIVIKQEADNVIFAGIPRSLHGRNR